MRLSVHFGYRLLRRRECEREAIDANLVEVRRELRAAVARLVELRTQAVEHAIEFLSDDVRVGEVGEQNKAELRTFRTDQER